MLAFGSLLFSLFEGGAFCLNFRVDATAVWGLLSAFLKAVALAKYWV